MLIPSMNLVTRVRKGELSFERFVEIMRNRGYITEQSHEEGCSFGSSAMEAVHQEEFQVLFSFFFPGEDCDIEIKCAATDDGGTPGAFIYALYNSKAIDREVVLGVLRTENEKMHA